MTTPASTATVPRNKAMRKPGDVFVTVGRVRVHTIGKDSVIKLTKNGNTILPSMSETLPLSAHNVYGYLTPGSKKHISDGVLPAGIQLELRGFTRRGEPVIGAFSDDWRPWKD